MHALAILFLFFGPMFQRATVVQMDLADCAAPHHSFLSSVAGVPETTQREACPEYVLTSSTVVVRLQTRKSEVLLVPGEGVNFRTGKGKLYLRRDDDGGELEGTVLCMRSANAVGDSCGVSVDPSQAYVKTSADDRLRR
jgi:hypothetical protein